MNYLQKMGFIVMLVSASFVGVFFACEQTEPEVSSNYENGEFLELTSGANLKDYFSLSNADKQMLAKAESRIKIIKKNGVLYMPYESGAELGVSQEIYEYFLEIVNRTNEIYGNGKNRKRRVQPGESTTVNKTKCVSYLLGHIYKRFGEDTTKYNQKTIDMWIVSNGYDKGDGVHPGNFEAVLGHFTEFSKVESSSWPSKDYNSEMAGGPDECFVAVCENGIGAIGHVVQIVKQWEQNSDYYLGYNPQDVGSKGEQGLTLIDKRTIGRVYLIKNVVK